MIPDDLQATLSIGLPCGPGETVPSSWMCILFLANTIKWPAAVRSFYAELRKNGLAPKATQDGLAPKATQDGLVPDLSRLGLGAERIVQAYRSTLVWASGRAWGHMFSRMDSGLQSAQSGLAVNGCKLGLLASSSSLPDSSRRRKTQKGGGQDMVLHLGPVGTEYRLVHSDSDDHKNAVALADD